MKKIVCTIYHDCNREARSHEILECLQKMGEVHYVSYAAPKDMPEITCHIVNKKHPLALLHFLSMAKKTIKKVKPEIVLLHDNDCSVLIPFIRKSCPKTKIVYDSSELYIPMSGKTMRGRDKTENWTLYLKQKLTAFRSKYEYHYLKDTDIVLAANIERAQIMQEYFGLKSVPIVFDNIHRIDDEFDRMICDKKFDSCFVENGFHILFAGGIGEERLTYDYIRSFSKVQVPARLIIAGSASAEAIVQYNHLVSELKLDNVFYIGMLTRAELRYCMQKCQASVVVFDQKSYNTIYCASGKCYESLFEGIPILASENPPLKRLCEERGIGVSNDDYAKGIEELHANYQQYVDNVWKYVDQIAYEQRIDTLCSSIERKLKV